MEKQKPQLSCLQGAPLQTGSKEVTFAALAATYGFTNKVTNLLLSSPMESLEDFRYYFTDGKGDRRVHDVSMETGSRSTT